MTAPGTGSECTANARAIADSERFVEADKTGVETIDRVVRGEGVAPEVA
jgi:hypothetical protein